MIAGAPFGDVACTIWRDGAAHAGSRSVAEETAIAFTYGGSTHAVMMATPADLEDFAVGFTLTEGLVDSAGEIEAIERIDSDLGIEMRILLSTDRLQRLAARRRTLAGPVGCGLCGIESLEAATRTLRPVAGGRAIEASTILAAMRALGPLQTFNNQTHSVHAAGYLGADGAIGPVREDVGRHNALDKLAGALARSGLSAAEGAVLLTSRVSVEMVQKTAMIGAPVLVAVSAPTALAIRAADEAGITLVAVARPDGFEIFTRPERIGLPKPASRHVA